MPEEKPKWMLIAADLRARIQSGELKPGGPIPSLRALTRRHGVSMPTVQRALNQLHGEGLVVSRERSGFFVTDPERDGHLAKLLAAKEQLAAKVAELESDVGEVREGMDQLREEVRELRELVRRLTGEEPQG